MRTWIEHKISSALAFVMIFLFILPTGYWVWKSWKKAIKEIDALANIQIISLHSQKISASEKKQIDSWIKKNNLNQYGDPVGTIYAGGTPLFDESTGQILDLYEYILKKHPDKPWRE